jgi:hypothetical protein
METQKTLSGFEKCLGKAARCLGKVDLALEDVRIELQIGNTDGAYAAAFDAAYQAERLALLTRELPVYSGHPRARKLIEDATLQSFQIEMGFTVEGWFCIRLPLLLPKKSKGSPNYISDPLYAAMKRFWLGKQPVRYPNNVIIFRHVFSRDRPERENRDHDNVELNRVVDIAALYVMFDDSPARCRHYYTSAPGNSERTEVYVVPQAEFIDWLNKENTIPEGGVTLYEKLQQRGKKHM